MKQVMFIYGESVKDIAMILLIIAGAGALKQILIDSGVSKQIADSLQNVSLSPLFLGWLTAAVIRLAVGSATVAGFTAAGIIAPLLDTNKYRSQFNGIIHRCRQPDVFACERCRLLAF